MGTPSKIYLGDGRQPPTGVGDGPSVGAVGAAALPFSCDRFLSPPSPPELSLRTQSQSQNFLIDGFKLGLSLPLSWPRRAPY